MAVTARSNKFRLESGGEARKIDPTMHCFMEQLRIRAGKFARNTRGLQWLTFCPPLRAGFATGREWCIVRGLYKKSLFFGVLCGAI